MTSARGNLIPTPILDKNGKLTTVHKKNVSEKTTTSFPPAQILGLSRSNEPYKQLLKSLKDQSRQGSLSAKELKSNLIAISSLDAKVVEEANHLISSGSEYARNRVRREIESRVQNYHEHDDPELASKLLKSSMLAVWHATELVQEDGMDIDYEDVYESLTWYSGPTPEENDHWRGIAILVVIDIPDTDENKQAFIEWASYVAEPAQVVALAKERSTLNPAVLRPLLEQQRDVNTAIKEGIL